METLEYKTLDRSGWSAGPWDYEQFDKRQWRDPETGLACLIKRNRWGSWCGYVGVKEGHPCHGKGYDSTSELLPDLEVHGGLTYADFCESEDDPEHGICHIDPADPRPVWWLGFDCAHCFDVMPGMKTRVSSDCEYRDVDYVTSEVTKLAKQLAAAAA